MRYKIIVLRQDGTVLSNVKFDNVSDKNEHIDNIRQSADQFLIRLNDTYLTLIEYTLHDDEWGESFRETLFR